MAILPIKYGNIWSWKSLRYCSVRGVRKPVLILRLWLINANSLSCSLRPEPAGYIKQCVINRPMRNKPLYDVAFTCRLLSGKQMNTCQLINVRSAMVDCFNDQGLRRIRCCMVLHHGEVVVSVSNESRIVVYPLVRSERRHIGLHKRLLFGISPKKSYRWSSSYVQWHT